MAQTTRIVLGQRHLLYKYHALGKWVYNYCTQSSSHLDNTNTKALILSKQGKFMPEIMLKWVDIKGIGYNCCHMVTYSKPFKLLYAPRHCPRVSWVTLVFPSSLGIEVACSFKYLRFICAQHKKTSLMKPVECMYSLTIMWDPPLQWNCVQIYVNIHVTVGWVIKK